MIDRLLRWIYIALLLALPFQTHYLLQSGSNQFTDFKLFGFDILFVLLVILFAIWARQIEIRVNGWVVATSVVILVLLIASGYWSIDRDISLYSTVRIGQALSLAAMTTILPVPTSWILRTFIANGLIQSLLSAWQFIEQKAVGIKWFGMAEQAADILGTAVVVTETGRFLRAYGSLPHPNVVGASIVIGIVSALALYMLHELHQENRNARIYLSLVTAIMSFGVLLTFSRSAILVYFIISLIILAVKPKTYPLVLTGITMLVVGAFILSPLTQSRLQSTQFVEQYSLSQRQGQLTDAKDTISSKFLYGTGLGTYTIRGDMETEPVHNVLLLSVAEIGILAALVFWGFVIYPLVVAPLRHKEGIAVTIVFIATLGLGVLDHFWWTLPSMLFLWFIILGLQYRQVIE